MTKNEIINSLTGKARPIIEVETAFRQADQKINFSRLFNSPRPRWTLLNWAVVAAEVQTEMRIIERERKNRK